MKKSKKLVSLLAAIAILTSVTACTTNEGTSSGSSSTSGTTSSVSDSSAPSDSSSDQGAETTGTVTSEGGETSDGEDIEIDEYTQQSREIYNKALGEFYEYYQQAQNATSVSERYAYMAIAEAKLLESGVFLPLSTKGGIYQISRVAPGTSTQVLWGNDSYRYHDRIVTNELIKTADYTEMKTKYQELKGSGTYEEWVKGYLAEKGYTIKDSFTLLYPSDPVTWDILATSYSADSEAIVNTYDNLLEYDMEGVLQPALAESYEMSDDGLTYTFHLRKGVKWVDSQGREIGEVKADDFLAGFQHMLDAEGGLEYLVDGTIKNAGQYIAGEITDFSQVGIEAVDDYTVKYTLEEPKSYFLSMLGYNVFSPMNRSFYESKGGKFGDAFDASAEDYTYGIDPDSIAYCGPYLVTNATAKNTIVFSANESYWDKDNINLKTITWKFTDSSDPTASYNDVKSGVIDIAGLNPSTIPMAKDEGLFDEYAYISRTDATTYNGFFNLNRQAYANTKDSTKVVSSMTDEQKDRANKALQNQNFRLAVCFALDRASHNAQTTGEEVKYLSIRNSYIPGNFTQLKEDVTIDINGTSQTFTAGTNYGAVVQAQIDADGFPIKAYDPNADDGAGGSDGYDGWYSPENAMAYLNKAIEELKAEGVEISAENPICFDMPYPSNIQIYVNRANVMKKSVEDALGGMVVVNLVATADAVEWYDAGYYPATGAEMNYNYADVAGWGPDFEDPCTYLDTMLPDYAGYMTKSIGVF